MVLKVVFDRGHVPTAPLLGLVYPKKYIF